MHASQPSAIQINPASLTTTPFNILEICFSQSAGGLELYMANISKYLFERGHRVLAVVPPSSFLHQRLRNQEMNLLAMAPRWRYMDFLTALQLARIIKRNSIHLLHVHQSADLSTAILAKKIAGRSKVIFTQQMESARKKKDVFHRWVYGNLDVLIGITRRICIQVKNNTPLPPERIFQLYYGINLRRFFPSKILRETWRQHFGIAPDEVVIGMVGRLEKGKGQDIFLQAAAEVTKKLPNLRFVLIGGETVGQTGYLSFLKSLAENLGIASKVTFTGFVENVHELTNMLDVIVLASKKETFGLSLIEAMATGAVPIGSNAGGVPEIIEHNQNGLLVPPQDPGALAKAMFRLAGDPARRKRLAQAARETVVKKFNLEMHLENLETIFSTVLNSRGMHDRK